MSDSVINKLQNLSVDDESVADQKIKEIREKAAEKFSKKEIDDFINMGKKLAGKPVLHALMEVIKCGPALGKSEPECARLCKKINALIPYNYCGYVSIGFKETTYMLNICLSLVANDYSTDIDIPSTDYVRDLYQKYDFLKEVCVTYWHQFMEDNPELIKRITEYRDDVDFSKLIVDDTSHTTLYWDEKCPKRIGLFAYYVDSSGHPFYKKMATSKNTPVVKSKR